MKSVNAVFAAPSSSLSVPRRPIVFIWVLGFLFVWPVEDGVNVQESCLTLITFYLDLFADACWTEMLQL